VAEAAAAVVAVERLDHLPLHVLHPLQHQLGDAVAAVDVERLGGVGVEQDHLDLAAVGSVDQAGRVGDGEAVLERVAAAG
jgi:hypothetical protein